ncbi:MAG: InlB B-repeat-containing protein, partial [Thermoplasmata archaeon]
ERYYAFKNEGIINVHGSNVSVNVSYKMQFYIHLLSNPSNGGTVLPKNGWFNASSKINISAIPNSSFEFLYWSGTGNGSYSGVLNPASITMNGPITEKANFAELYNVTFFETGLPSGTLWFVNLSNGKSYNTTGNSIEIQIPNGSYSYTIVTTNKEYFAEGGSLIVNGTNLDMSIKFNPVTYSIIFVEQGLPPSTLWSVTLDGNTLNSTTSTITFKESNGTYSYIIGYINGYNVSSISGTITVNGSNVTQAVTFTVNSTKTYNITFTESGLPAGATWSVTLNGITKTSKNNTIEFSVPYGTYNYTLLLPSGYKTSQSSGTITTAQSNTNVPIVISSTNSTSTSQSTTNSNELLWVGTITVVVLIAILSGLVFLKRSKNKKPPKQ